LHNIFAPFNFFAPCRFEVALGVDSVRVEIHLNFSLNKFKQFETHFNLVEKPILWAFQAMTIFL